MLVAHNLNRVLPQDDVDGLFSYLFERPVDQFQDARIDDYIQSSAIIQIYDEKAQLIYSKNAPKEGFSQEELSYIPEFRGDVFYDSLLFTDAQGEQRYLLTAKHHEDSHSKENGFMILDENLKVLESTLPLEKESFTQQEFDFLTGNYLEEGSFYRRNYINPEGQERTLVSSLPPL